jgi:hypothetical protein
MMNQLIVLQILTQPQELSTQGCILEAAIEAGTKEIINIKDSLNEWDSKVGDGDCGTTVSLSFQCLSECLFCSKMKYFTDIYVRCIEVLQLFLKIWKSGKLESIDLIYGNF